jgi:hypothetical protein
MHTPHFREIFAWQIGNAGRIHYRLKKMPVKMSRLVTSEKLKSTVCRVFKAALVDT